MAKDTTTLPAADARPYTIVGHEQFFPYFDPSTRQTVDGVQVFVRWADTGTVFPLLIPRAAYGDKAVYDLALYEGNRINETRGLPLR